MTTIQPLASIVIPTHNRRYSLVKTLDSLGRQTASVGSFEVIVVADGCRDGTQEMLADYRADFRLETISLAGIGSSAVRNAGAARADGDLIIFLDDDIQASPGFVDAHLLAHQKNPGCVVIGYFPPRSENRPDLFRIALVTWWEKTFTQMRQIGHRFTCQDVISGNLSISADTFRRVNGFDPALEVHEDYEFGMRLIRENIPIVFEPSALGYHYQATDIRGALVRKFQEGKADVQLGRLYPELRSTLLMNQILQRPRFYNRIVRSLAFHLPLPGDILAKTLSVGFGMLEWLRLRWLWRNFLYVMMAYWYWRGVAEEMRDLEEVKQYLKETAPQQTKEEINLDLAQGLEAAERLLDQARPASAVIHYGPHLVGSIPAKPGAERLRGAHLRRTLAVDLMPGLRRALLQVGAGTIFGSR